MERVKITVFGTGWSLTTTMLVRVLLPALLTVMDTANTPRPSAAKRLMKFKKARSPIEVAKAVGDAMPEATPEAKAAETKTRCDALKAKGLLIDTWTLEDIGADLSWCGRSGSPTKVHRIQSVVLTAKESKSVEPTEVAIAGMVHELIKDKTIA